MCTKKQHMHSIAHSPRSTSHSLTHSPIYIHTHSPSTPSPPPPPTRVCSTDRLIKNYRQTVKVSHHRNRQHSAVHLTPTIVRRGEDRNTWHVLMEHESIYSLFTSFLPVENVISAPSHHFLDSLVNSMQYMTSSIKILHNYTAFYLQLINIQLPLINTWMNVRETWISGHIFRMKLVHFHHDIQNTKTL